MSRVESVSPGSLYNEMEHGSTTLDAWGYAPSFGNKLVWYRDHAYNPQEKPDQKVFHQKGDPNFTTGNWGWQDHMRRWVGAGKKKPDNESPQQKEARKQREKEEHERNRKENRSELSELYDKLTTLMIENIWDQELHTFLMSSDHHLKSLIKTRDEAIAQAKRTYPTQKKERDRCLHSLTTEKLFMAGDREQFSPFLETINQKCKQHSVQNILGLEQPEAHTPSTEHEGHLVMSEKRNFLLPAISFLRQIDKQVGDIYYKLFMDELKGLQGNASLSQPEKYAFLNMRRRMYELKRKLRKNKFPKKLNPNLPDTPEMEKWQEHIRTLERKAYQTLHPGNRIPKYLLTRGYRNNNNNYRRGRRSWSRSPAVIVLDRNSGSRGNSRGRGRSTPPPWVHEYHRNKSWGRRSNSRGRSYPRNRTVYTHPNYDARPGSMEMVSATRPHSPRHPPPAGGGAMEAPYTYRGGHLGNSRASSMISDFLF